MIPSLPPLFYSPDSVSFPPVPMTTPKTRVHKIVRVAWFLNFPREGKNHAVEEFLFHDFFRETFTRLVFVESLPSLSCT